MQRDIFLDDREDRERVKENIVIFRRENWRLFVQGNQATSNEPIIKWNCLRSYGSRGGRAGQPGWARHPPPLPRLCRNNNVNLSPCFFLSLFLSLSINHGSRLHRRRQFAEHTKRVDNLKGKSSLLTEEGHAERPTCAPPPVRSSIMRPVGRGEPLDTVFVRSVEHNIITWTHGLLTLVLRSYISLPHTSLLFFPFSCRSPVCPSLNSRMLLGFAHWKHKSYARGTTISSKQAIKRTVIFLDLWAFIFAMFYLSTIRVFFLRIYCFLKFVLELSSNYLALFLVSL